MFNNNNYLIISILNIFIFSLTGENSACDYIQSGKVRTRMMLHFKRVLSEVDVIVTPANGTTAPPIPNLSDTEEESDITKQVCTTKIVFV